MLISALIHSAGAAAGGLFGSERSRALHAGAPPADAPISKKAIGGFAALPALLAIGVASLLGWNVLALCVGLAALTFLYEWRLKYSGFVGCLNAGACRFMNMWLGIAAAGGAPGRLWPLPATLGIYVTAVALLGLQEERKLDKTGFYALLSGILIALMPLAGFAIGRLGHHPDAWLALVALTFLAGCVFAVGANAARSPDGAAVRLVTHIALTGAILLDSAILFSYGKAIEGAACALVLIPAAALITYVARRPVPARAA